MVIAAAELLKLWPGDQLGQEEGAQIRMIIETGMFVTYARAFTDSKLGTVNPARGLTREQRELHAEVLEVRHKAYAHTEATPYREVVDVGDTDNWLVSSSWPLQPYLDDIIALAKAQLSGLLVVLEKADERLAEATT